MCYNILSFQEPVSNLCTQSVSLADGNRTQESPSAFCHKGGPCIPNAEQGTGDILPLVCYSTVCRGIQSAEYIEQGGFTASRGTEQDNQFTGIQVKVDPFEELEPSPLPYHTPWLCLRL